MLEAGTYQNLVALDLNTCDSISEEMMVEFLTVVGPQLEGLVLGGMPKMLEHFWLAVLPHLRKAKYVLYCTVYPN